MAGEPGGDRQVVVVREQVEDEMRRDSDAERESESRPADRAEYDPDEDCRTEHRDHGVRPGHVGEVEVRDGVHGRLGGHPFDSEQVERDPEELAQLNGHEQEGQRGVRKFPFEDERGGGVIDCKHGISFRIAAIGLQAAMPGL